MDYAYDDLHPRARAGGVLARSDWPSAGVAVDAALVASVAEQINANG
jgi:hypothetical protein